ncbi:bifunctional 4-hydroxy-2-oxoglutarate aldolase/2-dehydro-3-deoxy-phosphogluconate aldolase [Marinobacter nanhaiticus D15-8W]|uniref:2-dehydro-3-deoxy-phosphogluconate aldolase n=1 Tax=Marinobacter nanhaiticus D15-8W TaxID=626887 RepID=N6WQ09_9GAMM|nr:bifunctional 4-hydroxy-2-oxoglutarate aldolase/2-dehydro-3-deoxy-phosphogluconate aldolase [Marinobacter nanhaiticus]ENO13661.1 keto-hydroxyglutarate-aldolase/keto-deoxy-phosphogluconate aldolase [Marinobacter nanhaiticus D15-8W]BES71032.1 bifunctional 4-hydroxy-2-oxoglutarate aldolase/2-dehydro-3-deoxy-phosphogluconate aldolase [Marinobacter nanhaiticus D15-8W]
MPSLLTEAHRQQVQSLLDTCPLVPVIAINKPEHALPLGRALVAGGITILEITLRTPYGLDAIRELRAALPEAWVGAGTVTTIEQYREVDKAGAQFVITPGVTESLLEHATTARAPLLPGVATMSEMLMGYQRGFRHFKFFPAEVSGGVNALKAFAGPFPDVRFCPTGGIKKETAKDYLALDNVVAVGGSWLTPQDAIDAGDWDRVTAIAKESLALLKG